MPPFAARIPRCAYAETFPHIFPFSQDSYSDRRESHHRRTSDASDCRARAPKRLGRSNESRCRGGQGDGVPHSFLEALHLRLRCVGLVSHLFPACAMEKSSKKEKREEGLLRTGVAVVAATNIVKSPEREAIDTSTQRVYESRENGGEILRAYCEVGRIFESRFLRVVSAVSMGADFCT